MFKGKFNRSVLDYRCTDKLHSLHVSSQAKRNPKNYWTDEAKSSSFPHGERLHWNPVRDAQYPSAIPLELFPTVRTAHIDDILRLPCHDRACIPRTPLLSHSPCSKQHSALLKELAGHCHTLYAASSIPKESPPCSSDEQLFLGRDKKGFFVPLSLWLGWNYPLKYLKRWLLIRQRGKDLFTVLDFFSCFSLRCRAKNHYHSC